MATHLLVRLLLPALLLAAVPTARAQYVKSYTYFSNACDGVPDTMFAMSTATAGTCTPLACQAVTSGIHADAECDSSINPPTTAGYTGTVTYANQACTGTPTAVVAVRTGKCIGVGASALAVPTSYMLYTCSGTTISAQVCTDSACQTCQSISYTAGACTAGAKVLCTSAASTSTGAVVAVVGATVVRAGSTLLVPCSPGRPGGGVSTRFPLKPLCTECSCGTADADL